MMSLFVFFWSLVCVVDLLMWIFDVQLVQAPPVDVCDGHCEALMEGVEFIEDDLPAHWLLCVPHDKVGCQVMFDDTLVRFLDLYLSHTSRSCHILQEFPIEARDQHNKVHGLVFVSCIQVATYKDSKDCHITPSVFGDILYENFAFDIPTLMDLCVLYGQGNGTLLAKMIDNMFTLPKYMDDLAKNITTFSEVSDDVLVKCGIQLNHESPQKLGDLSTNEQPLMTMVLVEFRYVILYAVLEVRPSTCLSFHDSLFLMRFLADYESLHSFKSGFLADYESLHSFKSGLLADYESLHSFKSGFLTDYESLHSFQSGFLADYESLHSFQSGFLTDYESLHSFQSGFLADYESLHSFQSGFLTDYESLHSLKSGFLADYESLHSFQDDLEILLQAKCEVDEPVLDIQDAVISSCAVFGKAEKRTMHRGGRRCPDGSTEDVAIDGAIGWAIGWATGWATGGASVGARRGTGSKLSKMFGCFKNVEKLEKHALEELQGFEKPCRETSAHVHFPESFLYSLLAFGSGGVSNAKVREKFGKLKGKNGRVSDTMTLLH